MPATQLTTFEDRLGKLKSCASLVDANLAAIPHYYFSPANEQDDVAQSDLLAPRARRSSRGEDDIPPSLDLFAGETS